MKAHRVAPALRFQDLVLGYDRHPAVHHLTAVIEPGDLLAVVGPNGAGKSTLLKAITGSLRPISGRIDLGGLSPKRIAYLPQAADLDRSFPLPVYDLVAMGLWDRCGLFRGLSRADHARVEEALAAVGLTGFERRSIGSLSGGQMQRVLFARLLLQDAPVILLDEPFTAIDSNTTADLLDLVHRWHSEARTVVAVLHDLETVRHHFPKTLLLAREPVAFGATGAALSPENLLAARRMIEATNPFADLCERA